MQRGKRDTMRTISFSIIFSTKQYFILYRGNLDYFSDIVGGGGGGEVVVVIITNLAATQWFTAADNRDKCAAAVCGQGVLPHSGVQPTA